MRAMTRGKWFLAAVPIALVAGCGSSGSNSAARVTPSAPLTPRQVVETKFGDCIRALGLLTSTAEVSGDTVTYRGQDSTSAGLTFNVVGTTASVGDFDTRKQLSSVGCSDDGKQGASIDISGTLVLTADSDGVTSVGGTCLGAGGYEDIDEGTEVTLTNESGTILGTGMLSTGTPAVSGLNTACTFTFDFGQISGKAKFYSVNIGSGHRGKITDSAADLMSAGYKFSITLGP